MTLTAVSNKESLRDAGTTEGTDAGSQEFSRAAREQPQVISAKPQPTVTPPPVTNNNTVPAELAAGAPPVVSGAQKTQQPSVAELASKATKAEAQAKLNDSLKPLNDKGVKVDIDPKLTPTQMYLIADAMDTNKNQAHLQGIAQEADRYKKISGRDTVFHIGSGVEGGANNMENMITINDKKRTLSLFVPGDDAMKSPGVDNYPTAENELIELKMRSKAATDLEQQGVSPSYSVVAQDNVTLGSDVQLTTAGVMWMKDTLILQLPEEQRASMTGREKEAYIEAEIAKMTPEQRAQAYNREINAKPSEEGAGTQNYLRNYSSPMAVDLTNPAKPEYVLVKKQITSDDPQYLASQGIRTGVTGTMANWGDDKDPKNKNNPTPVNLDISAVRQDGKTLFIPYPKNASQVEADLVNQVMTETFGTGVEAYKSNDPLPDHNGKPTPNSQHYKLRVKQ